MLLIRARGFAERRIALALQSDIVGKEVVLDPLAISEQVTITANPGVVEDIEATPQQVNVIAEEEIEQRSKAVVAEVAKEEAGVHLQRTSPTVAGVFVRGLTGNKVNVFIDGVRYSTSAARGGINTFLDLLDASSLQTVEILRGPNSAQYGSDAIGGSLQFLSRPPPFANDGSEMAGRLSAFGNSADASFGSSITTSYATKRFGLLASAAGRRVNRLRPGRGLDSHNALTRFFGLSSDFVIGDRLPETAFSQYGGSMKMSWAPNASHHFAANYTRSQQDGGRRWDQLLGGDGNLVADLRNLMLDLFYVKYDHVGAAWFDSVSATYSINSQREERVNQGGNGNPNSSITHEYERTTVHGFQAHANKQWGARNALLIGGEYYFERMKSPSFALDPVASSFRIRRGRVPDRARYASGGLYAQDVFEALPNRLKLVGNIRYSAASYRSRASDAPVVDERRLWPNDSLRVSDMTFRAGAVVTPRAGLSLSVNVSRGFRAPHMTDLGTLGVTGSGFEVAAPDVAGLGAVVGSTADSSAFSTGIPVTQVGPETSLTYEVAARFYRKRLDTDLALFLNDIGGLITKQSLILPPGAVGLSLGDQQITMQAASGVVFVAASTNPVLVRANFDDARILGFEHTFDMKLAAGWSAGTVLTYLRARDRRTGLPPNIEGGTPAPDGYLKLRYSPSQSRFWLEPYLHAADRQERLSSLDFEDRRTGAMRTRDSIARFFSNGARARGLIGPGPLGREVLVLTGEDLARIQDRVLGTGVDRAPLFGAVPGYATVGVRGGIRFTERDELFFDLENITDRNYRGISWGVDAPGRGLYLKYTRRL
jgi:outer membrane receptor protein involved in Fe transport